MEQEQGAWYYYYCSGKLGFSGVVLGGNYLNTVNLFEYSGHVDSTIEVEAFLLRFLMVLALVSLCSGVVFKPAINRKQVSAIQG